MSQVAGNNAGTGHIAVVPLWMKLVLRPISLLLGLAILGVGAALVDAFPTDQFNFTVVCGVFTLVGFLYVMATTIVPGLQKLYHVFIVVAIDVILAIFWFSCMCAVAALRAKYKNVKYSYYYYGIPRKYLDMSTAVAILAAAEFIIFVIFVAFTCMAASKQGLFTLNSSTSAEAKPTSIEMAVSPGTEKPNPGAYQQPAQPAQNVYPAPGDAYSTAASPPPPGVAQMPDIRY